MQQYHTPPPIYRTEDQAILRTMENAFFKKLFLWMFGALMLTAATSYLFVSQGYVLWLLSNKSLYIGSIILELVLVVLLSARINKMSFQSALIIMVLYAILNGITLSSIFLLYTGKQIASTFLITSATFGSMAIFGSTTKKNLSHFARYAYMLLIGLIIATVVNIFLKSSAMMWGINIFGVLLFTVLTAIDTYRYREYYRQLAMQGSSSESIAKLALIGSLNLYLDFINLFLYLLRFVGRSN